MFTSITTQMKRKVLPFYLQFVLMEFPIELLSKGTTISCFRPNHHINANSNNIEEVINPF